MPHSPETEKAVLGSILTDEYAIEVAIEMLGSNKAFFVPSHQKIYESMLDLHKKDDGIDHISLLHALREKSSLEEIGGEIYLAELANSIATTANIESWCRIVSDLFTLRRLISACAVAMNKCYESDQEVANILDEVESSILDARSIKTSNVYPLCKLMRPAVQYMERLLSGDNEAAGIPTGFPDLDHYIIGMKPGEMLVLAARPSIGKTALALNIIRNVALGRSPSVNVMFFSLEMTAEQIARRLLCTEAEFSEKDFCGGNFREHDWGKVTNAANELSKASLLVDPTPGINVLEMRAKARRYNAQGKIDLIVIDYLQLMHADVESKSETRQFEVAKISAGIKSLAKEMNIPILVLAQLNRQAEMQTGGRAKLSNLRESGAIEQDADIVMFLHRDREGHRDASIEEQENGLDSELTIEKNRNGEVGTIHLNFFMRKMLFSCKPRYEKEDIPD